MAAQTARNTLRLPPLPTIKEILQLYRLRALRQLSQNFLLNERLTDKIVKAAGNISNCEVCEVGPGPGGITRSILNRGASRLIIVEKDKRFRAPLQLLAEACNNKLEIIWDDVLSFDMSKVFSEDKKQAWDEHSPQIHLIGNLPFNVATPLIIRWMKAISERDSAWKYGRTKMTLTFQKEVAERIVAPVSNKQRCRLSVMCQNWCKVDHKFTIPGTAFIPKPDVDVGVVHFVPLRQPVITLPFKMVEKVVRNIFAFRQKYSIRGAERLFPEPVRETLAKEMYARAEINETTQPFHLTVEEFGRLCEAYRVICDKDPKLYEYDSRAFKPDRKTFEQNYTQKVIQTSDDLVNNVSSGG